MAEVVAALEKDHARLNACLETLSGRSGEPVPDERVACTMLQTLRGGLDRHVRCEEAGLFPALRQVPTLEGDSRAAVMDDLDRAQEDHADLRALLSRLEKIPPGDPAFGETVERFGARLAGHMAMEARGILKAAADHLPAEMRESLGAACEAGPPTGIAEPATG